MDIADRPVKPLPRRRIAAFAAIFLALHAGAVVIAEMTVGRAGTDTAFQKLMVLHGRQVDWLVLGASHALPLAFGDVPGRLQADTGQSMAVLAEIGAGPLYNLFVFRQSLQDIRPRRLLYVVDSFAFASADWNEARIGDRTLLRKTPLRLSTAGLMVGMVARHGADPGGLLDYMTAFSKLNPPDRFPQQGWRGAADFETTVRLSRHAVQGRIDYLFPAPPTAAGTGRYLDVLEEILDLAQMAGMEVLVIKPPLPDAFRAALPDEAAFDLALRARLDARGIPFRDLSAALTEPGYFFDTDHLNRSGVDALYTDYLEDILTPRSVP